MLVSIGQPDGEIVVVDPHWAWKIEARIPAGHTPTGIAIDPTGTTAWVCERFRKQILEIDLESRSIRTRIAAVREPVACSLSADGSVLAVANLLPAGPANTDDIASAISLIRTADRSVTTIRLPNGSSSVRDIALAADGRYAYAVHTLGRYALPTTQLDRGWLITNVVSIIDVVANTCRATIVLDAYTQGAANPWGVAISPDGATLAISSSGTHEIHRINIAALHAAVDRRLRPPARVAKTPPPTPDAEAERLRQALATMTYDFTIIAEAGRERLHVAGNGPRGIAWAGMRVIAAECFSDSLAVVAPDGKAHEIPLAAPTTMSRERRGEMFFHDAQFCYQHWLSCSTCHPDVRTDGLNWDLLNDGLGNAKQTKNMLWGHRFPPAMLLGARGSAEHAIRKGLQVIQFSQRSEEDAMDIEVFLKSLQPTPSPWIDPDPGYADGRRGSTCSPGKGSQGRDQARRPDGRQR